MQQGTKSLKSSNFIPTVYFCFANFQNQKCSLLYQQKLDFKLNKSMQVIKLIYSVKKTFQFDNSHLFCK